MLLDVTDADELGVEFRNGIPVEARSRRVQVEGVHGSHLSDERRQISNMWSELEAVSPKIITEAEEFCRKHHN